MKTLIGFLFLSVAYAQIGVIYSDTALVRSKYTPVVNYTAGDIIRSDTAFYSIATGTGNLPSSGIIRHVIIETDTANPTAAAFIVRFFSFPQSDTTGTFAGTNTDTTGFNVKAAADNAAYTNSYHYFDKYIVGDVATTAQSYGGSTTGATSINMSPNLYFNTHKGKLWFALLSNGTYTPKKGGTYKVKVTVERSK